MFRQSDVGWCAGHITVHFDADFLQTGKTDTGSTTDMDTGMFGKGVLLLRYLKQRTQRLSSVYITCCSVIGLHCPPSHGNGCSATGCGSWLSVYGN